jgi:hypothetical protein
MKKITRVFFGDAKINRLYFCINRMNLRNKIKMTVAEKTAYCEFLDTCISDLVRYKAEMQKEITGA